MIKAKFFFSLSKEGLELGVCQERDWYNIPTSVFTNINSKVAFWDVKREAIIIIAMFLPQARAPLEDLLQNCTLVKLVWFSNGHFFCERWGIGVVWNKLLCVLGSWAWETWEEDKIVKKWRWWWWEKKGGDEGVFIKRVGWEWKRKSMWTVGAKDRPRVFWGLCICARTW